MKPLKVIFYKLGVSIFIFMELVLIFIVVTSIYKEYGLRYGVASVFSSIPVLYLNFLTWRFIIKQKVKSKFMGMKFQQFEVPIESSKMQQL